MQGTALDIYYILLQQNAKSTMASSHPEKLQKRSRLRQAKAREKAQFADFVEASPFCARKRTSGLHCMSCFRLGAVDSAKSLNLNPRCLMKPWTRI